MTFHKMYAVKPYLPCGELFINVLSEIHIDRVGKVSYMIRRPGYRPIIVEEDLDGTQVQEMYDEIDKHCPLCGTRILENKKQYKCPSCEWEYV